MAKKNDPLRAARANVLYRILVENGYLRLHDQTYRDLRWRNGFNRREVEQALADLVMDGRARIEEGSCIEVWPLGEEASCPAS